MQLCRGTVLLGHACNIGLSQSCFCILPPQLAGLEEDLNQERDFLTRAKKEKDNLRAEVASLRQIQGFANRLEVSRNDIIVYFRATCEHTRRYANSYNNVFSTRWTGTTAMTVLQGF